MTTIDDMPTTELVAFLHDAAYCLAGPADHAAIDLLAGAGLWAASRGLRPAISTTGTVDWRKLRRLARAVSSSGEAAVVDIAASLTANTQIKLADALSVLDDGNLARVADAIGRVRLRCPIGGWA